MSERITKSFNMYYKRNCRTIETDALVLKLDIALLKQIHSRSLSIMSKKVIKKLEKSTPILHLETKKLEEENKNLKKTYKEFEKKNPYFMEMFFVSYINSFNIYLSDIILEFFLKKPSLLGKREILLTKIIQANDINEIIEEEARLAMFTKSRKGFFETSKFFKKTLKIDINKTKKAFKKIYTAIEIRHLLIHNNGRVDKKFLEKTKLNLKINSKIKITRKYLDQTIEGLNNTVNNIDAQIMKKRRV